MKMFGLLRHLNREFFTALVATLPNDIISTRIRIVVLGWFDIKIEKPAYVYRNVLILGKVSIGRGSSISNNTSINGASAGIFIGKNVMIGPGCCLVAFDHGTNLAAGPMIRQPLDESAIIINDDVWIGANCTITRGVTIGTGSIVGANSVVTCDLRANCIYAGAPAKYIKNRN